MASPSVLSRLAKAYADPELRRHRRLASVAAFATVAALFGLLALDLPQGFAQGGFFEELFGGGGYRQAEPSYGYYGDYRGGRSRRHASRRHASHHRHARHALSERHVAKAHSHAHSTHVVLTRPAPKRVAAAAPAPAATPAAAGKRTVCVRACDGYFFQFTSAERRFDVAARESACSAACPDAETKLFVMPSGGEDVAQASDARHGELYSQYVARVKGDTAKPAKCGCHLASAAGADTSAALKDPTLRKGDMVVTPKGVRVFQGSGGRARGDGAFLSLAETRGLTPARRGALAAIDRVLKFPRHHPAQPAGGDEHKGQ